MSYVLAVEALPVIGGSAVVVLVSVCATLVIGLIRSIPPAYRDQIHSQSEQLDRQDVRLQDAETRLTQAEAREQRCTRRLGLVIKAARDAGIDLPSEVYE